MLLEYGSIEIAGKVAVVTGAGADGCGRAISRRLARDGTSVVVSDINEAGGRETVRLIEEQNGRAAFCPADVVPRSRSGRCLPLRKIALAV